MADDSTTGRVEFHLSDVRMAQPMPTQHHQGHMGHRTVTASKTKSGKTPGVFFEPGQLKQEEENRSKQDSLTQAKDRAQMTQTTAMSIVNVALLKAVIDLGPEATKYYYPSLVLISLSLVLQIIAGILGLLVSKMQAFYHKHHLNICEDLCEFLCCCRLRSKYRKKPLNIYVPPEDTSRVGLSSMTMMREVSSVYRFKDIDGNEDQVSCDCMPCYMTKRTYADYEYDILNTYEHWCSNMLEFELQAMEAETKIRCLSKDMKNLKSQIVELKQESTENAERDLLIEKLTIDINTKQEQINASTDCLMHLEIVREQGQLLSKYSSEVRKCHILKSVAFWQGLMNYIFYTVFVLNAFITGFGLATSNSNAAPGTSAKIITTANLTNGYYKIVN